MGVLSKLAVAIALSDVDALKAHKSWLSFPGKKTGFVLSTIAAAGSSIDPSFKTMPNDPLHIQKYDQNMNELTELLRDPEAMKSRFKSFMETKYGGPRCGSGADTLCSEYGENDDEPAFIAFQYNVELAQNRMIKSGGRVIHGITHLMDLTPKQFRGMLGMKIPEGYKAGVKATDVLKLTGDAPSSGSKDWRDEGAVTPIKDQGQCGSCWAFSTVQTMESAALVQGLADKDAPFIGAPQELVSCDKKQDEGCNGGLPANAFKYLEHTPLEEESDFPYTSAHGKRGKCKLDKSEGKYEVTKTTQTGIWGIGEDEDMTQYIMEKGTMSVAVHANPAWQTYQGGIMTYEECNDKDQPNHAVQAIAVDMDADTPYWVIRNSWTSQWGEQGTIRITKGHNTCNVAFESLGVEVKKYDPEEADQVQV